MIRGIERRRIFLDSSDCEDFLARLDRLVPEEDWRCFAWALMPNHMHLVIQGSRGGLSRLMARLNTGYARSFNIRHGRSGYLFQNRFKSRLVTNDADLLGLVSYVHRNPLGAGLTPDVMELETYAWCGYGALLGRRPARPFEAVHECLSLFADDLTTARLRLRSWMAKGEIPREYALAPPTRGAARSVGDGGEAAHRTIDLRVPAATSPDTALEIVIGKLCAELGISPGAWQHAGSRGPTAEVRSIISSVAVDELRLSRRIIGSRLGISATAVSHAARKGRSRLKKLRLRIQVRLAQPIEAPQPRG